MKTTSDIWYEVYDLGINQGLDSLNKKQLCLYSYIDLFYSLEMGGLSSLLYNASGDKAKFDHYITTLKYFGLNELVENFILLRQKNINAGDEREETSDDLLDRIEITKEVEKLDNKILIVVTEDRVGDWIAENYNELIMNLE